MEINMGFFPSAGSLGIPQRVWVDIDEDIRPDWEKAPPVRKGIIYAVPGSGVIRALVAAGLTATGLSVYRQTVGDAAVDVDDLINDIQNWLKLTRIDQGFARQQKKPSPAAPPYVAPGRGEDYEQEVLRALDELEQPTEPDDPGYQREVPAPPYRGGSRSFQSWLERKYHPRSVARNLRRKRFAYE